jgi:short-subunit dehydrogenase involved in D-alanine esterification of teichoic acids
MSFCLSEMRSSILITGCGDSDVALCLAEKLSTLGHEVIITQKPELVQLNEPQSGCTHIVRLQADVSTESGRCKLRARILTDFPQVNVLIHTAGHVKLMPPLAETLCVDWEAYKDTLRTDLMALVHLSTLFLPHLIRHSSHGLVVSVGAISDFQALGDYPLDHVMKGEYVKLCPNYNIIH